MCYFNRERHVHPFSSTPSFWVESRHSSKQSWTMWLRTSCRNVRAIGEKRPGSFLHMIIKQSHTSSRTCILQTVQCLSHTQLYYLWSLLHVPYYMLLHLPIVQVICLDGFFIFQLANTSNRRDLQTLPVME